MSEIVIDKDGIKTYDDHVEVPCPTCKRKGRVPDPNCFGKPVMYSGMNGDRVPHVTCRTCRGTGWIFVQVKDIISPPSTTKEK